MLTQGLRQVEPKFMAFSMESRRLSHIRHILFSAPGHVERTHGFAPATFPRCRLPNSFKVYRKLGPPGTGRRAGAGCVRWTLNEAFPLERAI